MDDNSMTLAVVILPPKSVTRYNNVKDIDIHIQHKDMCFAKFVTGIHLLRKKREEMLNFIEKYKILETIYHSSSWIVFVTYF